MTLSVTLLHVIVSIISASLVIKFNFDQVYSGLCLFTLLSLPLE